MFRFPSPRLLLWWVGRSVEKKITTKQKRMNTRRGLGSRGGWTAKSEAWLQSQLKKRGLFDSAFENVLSMLVKDNDITSCQLLLVKVLASLTSEYGIVFFFSKKKLVGRAMGNITSYLDGLNDRLTTSVFTNREIRNRTCFLGKLSSNSNYVHTTSLELTRHCII